MLDEQWKFPTYFTITLYVREISFQRKSKPLFKPPSFKLVSPWPDRIVRRFRSYGEFIEGSIWRRFHEVCAEHVKRFQLLVLRWKSTLGSRTEREQISSKFPFARNSLLFAPFLHRPVIKRQMKKKLAHTLYSSIGHDYLTCVNAGVVRPPPPPPPFLPPSPLPPSSLRENTHVSVSWLNVCVVRRKERNKRGQSGE